ncbi:amidase [Prochlorothrix hollandica]|uniref:Amidase n=1 Tax=Prochlorothrix hollandica PCC 9006 = CALU 1027 TaxID=317619 RepID=A0A0M2PVF1_PROHO|nr:amidase [Prochlorothrix hollandica]KKI98663.1 amidase [Prochlorothrix hollandica PCC 9006 = CALU 1027]
MNPTDLAFTPALDQASLIRQKQVSPLELVDLYLDRIERLNPRLGSYFTVMATEARAEAQAKTESLAHNPADLPPFFGVPLSIKDLNPVAGVPCSYGIAAARDRRATEDDGVVTRLRSAGFIILGKTATSQLASLPYTEPPGFAPARNPWNLDYTPGGSSGGAAAALAAGLCAVAQGSDGGGSLRGPALCCGVVGLKPSRGRVSFAPVGDRMGGMAVNGPLGRTVADTAALLDVMAGYVQGDPYWLPDPQPSFLVTSQRASRSAITPLRIGFTTTIPPFGCAAAPCSQAVETTAQRLAALGHHLEPMTLPDLTPLIDPFTVLWQCVIAEAQVPWVVLERFNRWLAWRAAWINSGAYQRALTQVQRLGRTIVTATAAFDAVLLPVYLHQPIRVGQWQGRSSAQTLQDVIRWIAPCPPFNASGQPALALPTGELDSHGLPLGVQLVGRSGDEATLLTLAAQLEAAHPWALRSPLDGITPF